MAAGCRVITSSVGALPETTGGYARIYPSVADHQLHGAQLAESLAAEFAMPWIGHSELSLIEKAHCAAVYSWSIRIAEWKELIETVTSRNRAGGSAPAEKAVYLQRSPNIAVARSRKVVCVTQHALRASSLYMMILLTHLLRRTQSRRVGSAASTGHPAKWAAKQKHEATYKQLLATALSRYVTESDTLS